MAYENLMKSVEETAQSTRQEIRTTTENVISGIRNDTSLRVETLKKRLLEEGKKTALSERNRRLYAAKKENRSRLTGLKNTIYTQAFTRAGSILAGLREEAGYPEIFRSLMDEAARIFSGEKIIFHIDPRDENLARKSMQDLGLSGEIVPDLTSSGGLALSTPDGTISILNTLESRLAKTRHTHKIEIFSTLYGRES
ncbi:MAG: V-type ATP synthase subunit E [Methanoregulaceae archaeon]